MSSLLPSASVNDADCRQDAACDDPTAAAVIPSSSHGTFIRRRHERWIDSCPRTTTICCRILVPLAGLILAATGLGYWLAILEAPSEYDTNDNILAKRVLLESLPFNATITALGVLPAWCFQQLSQNQTWIVEENDDDDDDGLRIVPVETEAMAWTVMETESPETADIKRDPVVEQAIAKMKELFWDDWMEWNDREWADGVVEDSRAYMLQCGKRMERLVRQLINAASSVAIATAAEDLSFNWIRCWNVSQVGSFTVYSPTQEQLTAASQQAEFYETVWRNDQLRIFRNYLDELEDNPATNISDVAQAWEQSLYEATGRTGCTENTAGSAWFWFTVMTTVGYGNQSPESTAGRRLIITLGFISILAFGAVLTTAGSVVNILFEDATARTRFSKFLARPLVETLIWGLIALSWIYVLGAIAGRWWDNRLSIETTPGEQFWFGYLSTTTVGLGDYFLNPEVLFMRDVVRFSVLFLAGFVYTSAFLNNLGTFLSRWLPAINADQKLAQQLRRTDLVGLGCNSTTGSEYAEDEEHANSSSLNNDDNDDVDNEYNAISVLEQLVAKRSLNESTGVLNTEQLLKQECLLMTLLDQTRSDILRKQDDSTTDSCKNPRTAASDARVVLDVEPGA